MPLKPPNIVAKLAHSPSTRKLPANMARSTPNIATSALKKKIIPTRVPTEKKANIHWLKNLKQSTELLEAPDRCIHVGDRESDIYDLFCNARELGTYFLMRTCVDRLAGDGEHTIADEMDVVIVKGPHRIETRDEEGTVASPRLR